MAQLLFSNIPALERAAHMQTLGLQMPSNPSFSQALLFCGPSRVCAKPTGRPLVTVRLGDEAEHCQVRSHSCNMQLVFLGEMMGSMDCIISIFNCNTEKQLRGGRLAPGIKRMGSWAGYICLRRHRVRQHSVKGAES